MTSQVPYLEDFIGPPRTFAVNTHDHADFGDVMQRASQSDFRPFVPHEFSMEGFLERLNEYIEHQHFDEDGPQWPPAHLLDVRLGDVDESCVDVCKRHKLTCEPTFFAQINNQDAFSQ